MTPIRVQWSAGQFSDTPGEHDHDADAIFEFAGNAGVDIVAGSEAQVSTRNHLLGALRWYAGRHGFVILTDRRQDCWIAVSRNFGRAGDARFVQCVPAVPGPASKGGHGPRGLFTATIKPHDPRYGDHIFVFATHFTTRASDPSRVSNERIDHKAADLARAHGAGADLVFGAGDLNVDDQRADGFAVAPLTTCWDEIGKWPTTEPTHGTAGPTLDAILSYDADRRVTCRQARAVDDTELHLFADHSTILASYDVVPRQDS